MTTPRKTGSTLGDWAQRLDPSDIIRPYPVYQHFRPLNQGPPELTTIRDFERRRESGSCRSPAYLNAVLAALNAFRECLRALRDQPDLVPSYCRRSDHGIFEAVLGPWHVFLPSQHPITISPPEQFIPWMIVDEGGLAIMHETRRWNAFQVGESVPSIELGTTGTWKRLRHLFRRQAIRIRRGAPGRAATAPQFAVTVIGGNADPGPRRLEEDARFLEVLVNLHGEGTVS